MNCDVNIDSYYLIGMELWLKQISTNPVSQAYFTTGVWLLIAGKAQV